MHTTPVPTSGLTPFIKLIASCGADPIQTDPAEAASALTGANSLRWKHDILMDRPLSGPGCSVVSADRIAALPWVRVFTTTEAGMSSGTDEDQLKLATSRNLVLVSCNIADFALAEVAGRTPVRSPLRLCVESPLQRQWGWGGGPVWLRYCYGVGPVLVRCCSHVDVINLGATP
jgi:hypothetical protein